MKQAWLAMAALGLLHGVALGQCKVGKETNEAKLLAYYAAPLAFSPSGTLERMTAGGIRAAFELTFIPQPSDQLRKTSVCFLPKDENSQLSPVLPRPRLAVGLPGGFFIEGTYLPPITVNDATPNMASVAVGFVRQLGQRLGVALRVHGTFGQVKGPITCNADALQMTDPNKACYGTAKSDDTYHPNIAGVEGAFTWSGSGDRYTGYAGAGFSSLRPRFQVGFQPANTRFDSTRVEVDLTRVSLMAGGRYRVASRLAVTAEVYSVPKDMTTVRVGGSLRVR
jgi:hypothetical protein